MKVSLIVAMDENRGIGKDNKLLWHLPEDMKRFKEITTGHMVLMGRKTYESIGKPLPNRTNIVFTRNKDYQADGCVVIHDFIDLINHLMRNKTNQLFIIGGSQIYDMFIDLADEIYATHIQATFDADAFFPVIDDEWKEVSCEEVFPDENNKYRMQFVKYVRKE